MLGWCWPFISEKKAGRRAGQYWVCGWVRHKNVTKEADMSDLMSEKSKDNFQTSEKYMAIWAEHKYKIFISHVNKYKKRKTGCHIRGDYK